MREGEGGGAKLFRYEREATALDLAIGGAAKNRIETCRRLHKHGAKWHMLGVHEGQRGWEVKI